LWLRSKDSNSSFGLSFVILELPLKILHIAPFNTSGVPGEFVRAERFLGHNSRLVTLVHDRRGYGEDICLNLPFIDLPLTFLAKKLVSAKEKLVVDNVARIPKQIPPQWRPNNIAEAVLVRFRDMLWTPKVYRAIDKYGLLDFDVYQLDGGLGFFRDARIILQLKRMGKKIICCYTGSDLRTRGVIPQIDAISDLNVTLEFDHLQLHPYIHHVFFPFDVSKFKNRMPNSGTGKIKIGHAPTVRKAKGSEVIIPIIQKLQSELGVEMVLIENMTYTEAITKKAECDIFIDQIGDLGYGINGLESLAMGIPTCSCLAAGFAERYPDHPFIEINAGNLREKLIQLIEQPELREKHGTKGRRWVEEYHDAVKTVCEIHRLAGFVE